MNWTEWMRLHANLFALSAERDAGMLSAWASLFNDEGFAPEEMAKASKQLALAGCHSRAEQLQCLAETVRDWRRRAIEKDQNDPIEPPGGKCSLCSCCGFVTVPARGIKTAGGNIIPMDSTATCAVICSCKWGKARTPASVEKDRPRLMTLEDYVFQFPNWREDMARINALAKKRSEAHRQANDLDRSIQSIISKIRRAPA